MFKQKPTRRIPLIKPKAKKNSNKKKAVGLGVGSVATLLGLATRLKKRDPK